MGLDQWLKSCIIFNLVVQSRKLSPHIELLAIGILGLLGVELLGGCYGCEGIFE